MLGEREQERSSTFAASGGRLASSGFGSALAGGDALPAPMLRADEEGVSDGVPPERLCSQGV
jgi:hypothetical protein